MISSPFIYLLTLAFVVATVSFLEKKIVFKNSQFISLLIIFFFVLLLHFLNVFSEDLELKEIQTLLVKNISYLLVFFVVLIYDDLYRRLKEEFGRVVNVACSCTVGIKNYYILLLSSYAVSLFVQEISVFYFQGSMFVEVAFIFLSGLALRTTKLKKMTGCIEILKSLFYILVAVLASL